MDSGIVVKCFKNHFVARLVILIFHVGYDLCVCVCVCVCELRSYKHFTENEKKFPKEPDAFAFVKMQQCALYPPFARKMQ